MMQSEDLMDAAEFLTKKNSLPDYHIGYLGTTRNDIFNDLQELDLDPESAAFLLWENEDITGFLGMDADQEKGTAELWGPFIKEIEHGELLWNKAISNFKGKLHTCYLFADIANLAVSKFAEKIGFTLQSSQTYMELKEKQNQALKEINLIAPDQYSDFKNLHDTIFPNTYYSGKEIIEKINDKQKLYTAADEHGLKGYLYAEYNPEGKEGSLEFVGVKETCRHAGIGRQLLDMAVSDLFFHHGALVIKLCAGTTNEKALSLYKKAGFKVERALNFYIKKIEGSKQ
ncbi:GNAT family N-acetyltransferase [Bacillus sp. ISL-47]|nr:N-acetyltransferase [Bacillus sp. ISL-47]MBT2689581.1 GNAT family N-acetyltransferase [Bacillus sp. ISL-47]